jgi:formylmethanofuran dehydrogenase subunit E
VDSIDKHNPRKEIEEAIDAGNVSKLLLLNGMLHGHFCPGLALGVKAGARAVRELKVASTGMEEVVAIVETNSCFSDGIQMVTGCTLGNNALIYRDYGKTAFTLAKRTGEAVRLNLKEGGSPLERYPEAADLFNKVIRDRTGTEEDSNKLRDLWIDIAFNMLDVPDEEFFVITHKRVEVPAYARIFDNEKCSICGENIMAPRARMIDEKAACIPCSGQAYYQLAGDGISAIVV